MRLKGNGGCLRPSAANTFFHFTLISPICISVHVVILNCLSFHNKAFSINYYYYFFKAIKMFSLNMVSSQQQINSIGVPVKSGSLDLSKNMAAGLYNTSPALVPWLMSLFSVLFWQSIFFSMFKLFLAGKGTLTATQFNVSVLTPGHRLQRFAQKQTDPLFMKVIVTR